MRRRFSSPTSNVDNVGQHVEGTSMGILQAVDANSALSPNPRIAGHTQLAPQRIRYVLMVR
ncbi:hypothetical protein PG993_013484 [Apiospora rasikravindrae]|uniref:Uncharacterized protein n=1 Tax=Apiospora rasikravindrae TaxID=990691 RepID=A0ABR1RZ07_9PEZI